MPKFATKAADNMFCQARYEAAKFNERLSSREGAAEELGVDRTRLARIELGSVTPYPEEVLLMADIYRAPELKGNYCREMCPLGKGMPKIENQDIDRKTTQYLSFSLNSSALEQLQNRLTSTRTVCLQRAISKKEHGRTNLRVLITPLQAQTSSLSSAMQILTLLHLSTKRRPT